MDATAAAIVDGRSIGVYRMGGASWQLDPPVVMFVLLTGWLYARGVHRLAASATNWPRWSSVAFALGEVALLVILLGPSGARATTSFALDSTNHVLLTLLVPVLLACGRPITLLTLTAQPGLSQRVRAALRSKFLACAAFPAFSFLLVCIFLVLPLTSLLSAGTLRPHVSQDAVHLLLLAVGCLLCFPMVGLDEVPGRIPHVARFSLLILASGAFVLMGYAIAASSSVFIGAYHPAGSVDHLLSDQERGGSVITWLGTLLCVAYCPLIFKLWISSDFARARRRDREEAALEAAGRPQETELALYNAYLAALARRQR